MVLRGLLVAAAGFLFIFSPGLPMGLLARGKFPIERGVLLRGIGLWLAALLPALFIQSLLLQIFYPQHAAADLAGRPADYLLTLLSAFILALFVQLALLILLRRRKKEAENLLQDGMMLGFGVGLIAQVFNGLILVGAGFRLMYGDLSSPTLAAAAGLSMLDLLLGLAALVMFRPALLVVSAAQGLLVARAVSENWRYFWLAVAVDVTFAWAILGLKIALGGTQPGQVALAESDRLISAVTLLYYILAFGIAYYWLAAMVEGWSRQADARSKRRK